MSAKDIDARRRRRDRDSDRDSSRSRDKDGHGVRKVSRRKRRGSKDRDGDSLHITRTRSHSKKTSLVPELDRRPSSATSASSRSYPSFSKAHSRESLHPRNIEAKASKAPYTPDPTDLGRPSGNGRLSPRPAAAPPSPPLTADEPDVKNKGNGIGTINLDKDGRRRSSSGRRSGDRDSPRRVAARVAAPKSSLRQSIPFDDGSHDSDSSNRSAVRRHALRAESSRTSPSGTRSTTDSDATSIPPNQVRGHKDPLTHHSLHDVDPFVRIASPVGTTCRKATPVVQVISATAEPYAQCVDPWRKDVNTAPPPPPPPPPVVVPGDVSRVDYLLPNGGLSGPVHQTFSAAAGPPNHIFAPFMNLLEGYNEVIKKHGSIAVATGYRSVARRLLNRLEAVFARDISSENCQCVMCLSRPVNAEPREEATGVSWGEILEFVSGRRELPHWPPFSIDADAGKLEPLGLAQAAAPMQELDIDVPEEYRDHYIKQSKKTKQAVQSWLATQPESATSPPQEVDDETLTFAMLTHLEPEKRPVFTALLRGMNSIPASRTSTPLNVPRSDVLVKTAVALQRLYRLSIAPRDPECAIFLLANPALHSVLATLAAVSGGEWEILISGRFDGFLWSGADGPLPASVAASSTILRGQTATPSSRTTTPFNGVGGAVSRGPTPFQNGAPDPARPASTAPSSFGAPVLMDEEVEIATLAEVERGIFSGMEALEDAFEALHCQAEVVRRALRERSAGLALAAQARRGPTDGGIEVRLGTPASGVGACSGGGGGWDTETDDGLDERSELAPDDSASNVSYSRRRRPTRRKQRNTPAPVEEEDEGDSADGAQRKA